MTPFSGFALGEAGRRESVFDESFAESVATHKIVSMIFLANFSLFELGGNAGTALTMYTIRDDV